MSKYYEVWGCEDGNPPPVLLYKFHEAQWDEEFRVRLLKSLDDQGVTRVEVREVRE